MFSICMLDRTRQLEFTHSFRCFGHKEASKMSGLFMYQEFMQGILCPLEMTFRAFGRKAGSF